MGRRGKYYCPPPEEVSDFRTLFKFIWNAGVGNDRVGTDGPGEKWRVETLVAALDEQVSTKTVDNWLSGAHPPSRDNWRRLLDLISTRQTREAWLRVILRSLQETEKQRSLAAERLMRFDRLPDDLSISDNVDATIARRSGQLSTAEAVQSIECQNRPGAGMAIDVANTSAGGNTSAYIVSTGDVPGSLGSHEATQGVAPRQVPLLAMETSSSELGKIVARGRRLVQRPFLGPVLVGFALVALFSTTIPIFASGGSQEAAITARPGERFKDRFKSSPGNAPEMVMLPRGAFVMGSPETEPGRGADESRRHTVNIDYRLAVSVHEVTWDEYELCVRDGACAGYVPDDRGWGKQARPVINISWNDAYTYLHWLNDQLGIVWERGDRYTFLTEAEWEYAAFAGGQGSDFPPYSSGFTISSDVANFNGLSIAHGSGSGRFHGKTMPVGSYPANRWGLHDMHGNVWEWVEDCYRDHHQAMPNDGRAWIDGPCNQRVAKGGSFLDPSGELRAANRNPIKPEDRNANVGIRLARRPDGAW